MDSKLLKRADVVRTLIYFLAIFVFHAWFDNVGYTVLFGVLAFFFVLIPHALRVGKSTNTLDDYFLMGRELTHRWLAGSLLSTNLSLGNLLIVVCLLGYFFGWAGFVITCIAVLMNIIGLRWFLPHIKGYIENPKIVGTIHQFISIKHTPQDGEEPTRLRRFTAVITVFGLILALVLELHIASQILAHILQAGQFQIFLALVLVIGVYSSIAGYGAVVFTDFLQAILNVVGIIAILVAVWLFLGHASVSFNSIYTPITHWTAWVDLPWTIWCSLPILSFFWFIASMDQWQRSAATKSYNETWIGSLVGIILMGIVALGFVALGIVDKTTVLPAFQLQSIAVPNNDGIPLNDIIHASTLDGFWLSLACAGFALSLIFASLSTADTFLVTVSQSIIGDIAILSKRLNISTWHDVSDDSRKIMVQLARGCTVTLVVLIVITWLLLQRFDLLQSIFNFFFLAYSLQFTLTGAVLFSAFAKRRSVPAALLSVLAGSAFAILGAFALWSMVAKYEPFGFLSAESVVTLAPVLCAFSSILVYWLIWLVDRKRGGETSAATPT